MAEAFRRQIELAGNLEKDYFVTRILTSMKRQEHAIDTILERVKDGDFSGDDLEALKTLIEINKEMLFKNAELLGYDGPDAVGVQIGTYQHNLPQSQVAAPAPAKFQHADPVLQIEEGNYEKKNDMSDVDGPTESD